MRILHLIPSVAGGGAERQLAYLARAHTQLGHDIHVAYIHPGPNAERLRASGATIHHLSAQNNHDPRLLLQVHRLLQKVRPDLLQTWLVQMDVLGGLAARVKRLPWLLSEMASADHYPGTWKNRLRAFLARRAQGIVSNSSAGDRYWQSLVGDRALRAVIRNGLPIDEMTAAAPLVDPALAADREVIFFGGRLCEQKNLEHMLPALSLVLKRRPKAMAVICGVGPQQPDVDRWARDHDPDSVRLPGYLLEESFWAWMKRARLFLLVSFYEGQPNAVLEAMACECPLLVSDIPEHREFLDEETASLVNPRDTEAIAAAIERILTDREATQPRIEKARQRVEDFALPKIARRYEHLYQRLVTGAATRRA